MGHIKMTVLILLLGCLHATSAVTHSWKAFYTGSTGLNQFPEFVALNLLDDEVMGYFDSRTNRFESKQSWMMENLGQEYVEQETNTLRGYVPTFKASVGILMERLNQSKGIHLYQEMYGCEWDDETGEVKAFKQFGYDGEDFVAFDFNAETWIAPTPQAVITKHKWDNNKGLLASQKQYYSQICPDWLKKYVDYGRSSLLRKDLPSVSLLQKTPSSPVSCHATGFYPERATMFWRKDGEDLHEDVEHGEILPNNDGSFQMSVDLNPPTEDWEKYECVFQLAGVKNDIVTKLEKPHIRANERNPSDMTVIIVIVAVVVLALVAIAVIGYFIYKKNKAKRPPSPVSNPEVLEELNPKA